MWETGGGYPDTEIIPSIANYFGITIDELFGYHSEWKNRIDYIVANIRKKDLLNNGEDVCVDECLAEARNALAEYPSNGKIMLCLADILYNAGFARHGEYHAVDMEGFDVRDVELHQTYTEWQEAIRLYETLIPQMDDGKERDRALRYLITLYAEIGENEKAAQMACHFSELRDCRELVTAYAYDGKKHAERISTALLELVSVCSEQMVHTYMSRHFSIASSEAVVIIKNAISIYDLVCTDGQYGLYYDNIARLYLYLSTRQWETGDRDGAFASLDRAYECEKKYHAFNGDTKVAFGSPLLRDVKINPRGYNNLYDTGELPDIFPWWCGLPTYDPAMKEDKRWADWVKKCKGE